VAEMVKQEIHKEFWWRSLSKSSHLEDQEEDGRLVLKSVIMKGVRIGSALCPPGVLVVYNHQFLLPECMVNTFISW